MALVTNPVGGGQPTTHNIKGLFCSDNQFTQLAVSTGASGALWSTLPATQSQPCNRCFTSGLRPSARLTWTRC